MLQIYRGMLLFLLYIFDFYFDLFLFIKFYYIFCMRSNNNNSNYGHNALKELFKGYGEIVRHKFVQPDDSTQPGYGFVQFARVSDAHKAITALENTVFNSGQKIYLSIALRRRSSLTDEPTNLYVKNIPNEWGIDKLKQVFSKYGSIRQSKVMGDGIAFVRYETHEQALNVLLLYIYNIS